MAWFVSILILLVSLYALAAPTKEQMKQIKLPAGFQISVFAEVPNARQMALSPSGTLFVGSRHAGNVYAIPNALEHLKKKNGSPLAARTIATGLSQPNGVAFHEGALYVAAISDVLRFPDIEKNLKGTVKQEILTEGYPTDVHHGWKYLRVGPDGWLYLPVGAPCNNCLSKEEIYASITRLSLDGKKREIVARGVRNTVGFDWHPETKELWFTENGRDMWGDDRPGDELNHLSKHGEHFGYPHCHEMGLADPEYGKNKDCSAKGPYKQPALALAPHTAALGMRFYRGSQFPAEYKNKVFMAEHGSWNRAKKMGYRVMLADVTGPGSAANYRVFAEGWLQGEEAWGRPVDLIELPDGSMFLSDDGAGVVYHIRYQAPKK